MKTMTKEQFEKAKESLARGGDFWNKDKIWYVAFSMFPDAKEISYKTLFSGLYCDILVDGKEGRIYA
jgi:hypothetical protein